MAQVQATVGIKKSPFKNGLDSMRNDAKKWGSDIKSTIAGAFAFGAVASFFSNFVGEMARVKDLADRLGESSATIQRVGNAAKLSGTDLETIIKVMTKLTLATKDGAEKFEAVGISAAAFANAGTEEKILLLADAYDKANGNQDKMLALMDLLGPKGQDVMILLAGGADAVKQAFAEVPTVSQSAVDACARFDDAMDSMKQKAHQIAGEIVLFFGQIGAAVVSTVEMFTEGGSFSGNFARNMNKFQAKPGASGGPRTPADLEDKKAAADAAKKQAEASKALDAEMLDLARSRMTEEQKITDLKREQAAQTAIANDKAKDTTTRLEATKKVLELQQQIETGEKSIAKTKQDEADKLTKKAADDAEKIATAEGAVADEQNQQALAKMDPNARIAELKKQQKALFDQSDQLGKGGDREAAAKAKLEALKMNSEIDSAQKELDGKTKTGNKPSIISSALGSIGGGGGAYMASGDPLLQENRRQTNLLNQIARNTSGRNPGGMTVPTGSQLF